MVSDTTAFDIKPLTLSGTLEVISGGQITLSGPLKVNDLNAISTLAAAPNGEEIVILNPDNEIANAYNDFVAAAPGKLGLAKHYLIYDSLSAIVYTEHGILRIDQLLERLLSQIAPRFDLEYHSLVFLTDLEADAWWKRIRGILTRSSQLFTSGVLTRSGDVGGQQR